MRRRFRHKRLALARGVERRVPPHRSCIRSSPTSRTERSHRSCGWRMGENMARGAALDRLEQHDSLRRKNNSEEDWNHERVSIRPGGRGAGRGAAPLRTMPIRYRGPRGPACRACRAPRRDSRSRRGHLCCSFPGTAGRRTQRALETVRLVGDATGQRRACGFPPRRQQRRVGEQGSGGGGAGRWWWLPRAQAGEMGRCARARSRGPPWRRLCARWSRPSPAIVERSQHVIIVSGPLCTCRPAGPPRRRVAAAAAPSYRQDRARGAPDRTVDAAAVVRTEEWVRFNSRTRRRRHEFETTDNMMSRAPQRRSCLPSSSLR